MVQVQPSVTISLNTWSCPWATMASKDKWPLDKVDNHSSSVEHCAWTALQKAVRWLLPQVKNRSWPEILASFPWEAETKSLLACNCLAFWSGSGEISNATEVWILAMSAPKLMMALPQAWQSCGDNITPPLLEGWQQNASTFSLEFQHRPWLANMVLTLVHFKLMGMDSFMASKTWCTREASMAAILAFALCAFGNKTILHRGCMEDKIICFCWWHLSFKCFWPWCWLLAWQVHLLKQHLSLKISRI